MPYVLIIHGELCTGCTGGRDFGKAVAFAWSVWHCTRTCTKIRLCGFRVLVLFRYQARGHEGCR